MKLIRYGKLGQERTGVQIDGKNFDTSGFGEDYNEAFFASGGLKRLADFVANNQLEKLNSDIRIASPIARPSKILCIGLNYKDHAAETGAKIPSEPIIFMKSTTAVIGPDDDIMIPKGSTKTDWEVEFCVVIGKKASYVEEADAEDYIAGYLLHNDVSEREYQLERGGTWDKGKGCDTFAPLGPVLATRDEIKDINDIDIWLKLNGEIVQKSNTKNLIFDVPFIISYVSKFMTLLPGDIISTGTPAGVGLGMNPPVYLKPGDVLELGADSLGVQKQNVIAYRP
ncbi:fumarylacetoacetate hydrolase family protein [Albibacterium profundi]|uniref:Fumarylacetoacetate hydrolase family protein n=1 Tax=Albibacterium profundi TaxID=3134906 RepID=A0ABV5CCH5_9SPHI